MDKRFQLSFNNQSLQWAVGILYLIIGMMMLVTPHQFDFPAYQVFLPHLHLWGSICLILGFMLIAIAVSDFPRIFVFLVHFSVGTLLLLTIKGFIDTQIWIAVLCCSVLGLGIILSGLIPSKHDLKTANKGDSLIFTIGISSMLAGLSGLIFSKLYSHSMYDQIRSWLPLLNFTLFAGGAMISISQIVCFTSKRIKLLIKTAPFCVAFAILVFIVFTIIPAHIWISAAYYGVFALALVTLPHVSTYTHRILPGSLQARIMLILMMVTIIPTTAIVTLVSNREEQAVKKEALNRIQSRAMLLGQDITDYLNLYHTALLTMSQEPQSLSQPINTSNLVIHQLKRVYFDDLSTVSIDPKNAYLPLNSSEPGIAAIVNRFQNNPSNIKQPSMAYLKSQAVWIGLPMVDSQKSYRGFISIRIPNTQLKAFLKKHTSKEIRVVSIVAEDGNFVLKTKPESSIYTYSPKIDLLLKKNLSKQSYGAYIDSDHPVSYLIGYAHIPETKWSVVMERPLRNVMVPVYYGREIAFGFLLLFLVLAAIIGVMMAARVTSSLSTLAHAAREFADGKMDAPLPRKAILEIDRLATTFDEMRNRLTIRTAEREQAEAELLKAKEELESIVAARTVELLATNSKLRMELNERTRIESERERLRMEAEQRAAELESFISSCADGVALIDHHRQLIWLNEACHSILASCPDEIIRQWGLKYPSVEPDDDNFAVEDAPCRRALQGETLRDVRSFIVSPDGNDACISVSASPVCNSNNQIIGATIIFRDISDQIALEKQRQTLYEKEHSLARTLQKALIPAIPAFEGNYKIAAKYVPVFSEDGIGGDFYDVFRTVDNKIGILIGDVSGKGAETAALGASARSIISAFAYETSSVAESLNRANSVICSLSAGKAWAPFVAVFLAILDPESGELSYSSAGHPPAIILRKEETVDFLAYGHPPIGMLEDVTYEDAISYFNAGDKILFYTDGILEARHGMELFGLSGIEETLRHHCNCSPDQLITEIYETASHWAQDRLTDDVALIVIERCTGASTC